jgi:hypothetical protein
MRVSSEIIIAEPEVPKGELIGVLLDRLVGRVERAVSDLEPFLYALTHNALQL